MRKILFGLLFISSLTYANSWLDEVQKSSYQNLLSNISRSDTPRGFVVASPSKIKPNYYYHWVRDAALVMKALMPELALDKNQADLKFVMMDDYINLVSYHQKIFKLTGQGEPKFNPDGTSYQFPWGRPQNDGPALRALILIDYAFELIKDGKVNYVTQKLYSANLPASTVIKRDLEYVSHHWREGDFDLWEEVKGTHFYTRMVQRAALIKGAKLARQLGDLAAANWYLSQASQIDTTLKSHWSDQLGYIQTTLNYQGGLHYKYSNLDTSVLLAANHTEIPELSFAHDDPRMMKTFAKLVEVFANIYPINHGEEGYALGRYPEDVYYGGNPWFLLTNAAAEYLLKLNKALLTKQKIIIDANSQYFVSRMLNISLAKGVYTDAETLNKISEKLKKLSMNFLLKNKKHMHPNGRMDEQFDKYTGYMLGARDLTWSYASFLTVYRSL